MWAVGLYSFSYLDDVYDFTLTPNIPFICEFNASVPFNFTVPCGYTDLVGSAMNDSALLLVKGTERQTAAVFPRGRCA